MKKKISAAMVLITASVIVLALLVSDAAAWGGFRGRHHYNHGFHHGYYQGYYGWGNHWPYWYDYSPSPARWHNYGPVAPPVGAFIAYLPEGYATVVAGGTTYYFCGGYYFRPYSNGYVIVPAPAVSTTAAAPQTQEPGTQQQQGESSGDKESTSGSGIASQPSPADQDTATINIPNSKGGFTPVKLTKRNNGYIGPQGEFYAGHPTVEQLRALYGK